MGFLDKAKAAAEQAASKAKEKGGELQTKRDLGQAYDELGHRTFDLIESGELSAPALDSIAERIRSLEAQLDADEGTPVAATATTESSEPSESDATPT